jgi:hypothetical protein
MSIRIPKCCMKSLKSISNSDHALGESNKLRTLNSNSSLARPLLSARESPTRSSCIGNQRKRGQKMCKWLLIKEVSLENLVEQLPRIPADVQILPLLQLALKSICVHIQQRMECASGQACTEQTPKNLFKHNIPSLPNAPNRLLRS